MRFPTIMSEAWRNVSSNAVRTLSVVLATAIICVLLGVASFAVAQGFIAQGRAFQASGAATMIVTSESAVDGIACDSLSKSSAVHGSGALRATTAVRTAAAPAFEIPTFAITAGFAALLGPSSGRPGALISQQLADRLTLRDGGDIVLPGGGRIPVAGIYEFPEDGRISTLAFAILLPTDMARAFDECWAKVWPSTAENRDLVVLAARGTSDAGQRVAQLNSTRGIDFDGAEGYAQRITRWSPLAAFGLVAAIFLLATRLRRVTIASDLHAGMRKPDVLAILLAEGMVTIAPALCAGLLVAAAVVVASAPGDTAGLAYDQVTVISSTALGMVAGVTAGVSSIRQPRLFDYLHGG